jgi:hypothetical protein
MEGEGDRPGGRRKGGCDQLRGWGLWRSGAPKEVGLG